MLHPHAKEKSNFSIREKYHITNYKGTSNVKDFIYSALFETLHVWSFKASYSRDLRYSNHEVREEKEKCKPNIEKEKERL